MKHIFIIFSLFIFATEGFSHGGQYRGPRDIVPPGGNPNYNPPTTPLGPITPPNPGDTRAPTTPTTPTTPTGPQYPGTAPGVNGPTTGSRGEIIEGYDSWVFWWNFNKDRFLNLKRRISEINPTTGSDEYFLGILDQKSDDRLVVSREEILRTAFPIIEEVLRNPDMRQKDELSSALIAIAKFGVDTDKTIKLIVKFLSSKTEEVRETAALSLGILADKECIPILLDVLKDTQRGRLLTQSHEVDLRTRAFAAYGLGLVSYRTKISVESELLSILNSDTSAVKDIKVACVTALGLCAKDCAPDLLKLFYSKKKNFDLVRAHIPAALVRMGYKDIVPVLEKTLFNKNEDMYVRQSAVLAIGHAAEYGLIGVEYANNITKSVINHHKTAKRLQEKQFAGITLGQLGTKSAIDYLIKEIYTGKKIFKPWAALGLGVHCYLRSSAEPDIMDVLTKYLDKEKDPSKKGAYAIALGLARHQPSYKALLKEFNESKIEDTKGYMALGLGLMNAPVEEYLRPELKKSIRKPTQLQQISIGLGLMATSGVSGDLIDLLKHAKATSVMAALAQSLGFIGDGSSLKPLIDIIKDMNLTGEARAFAIVAIGIVGDKESLPWNSKIAENINYRAPTSTLTGGAVGILDIL